MGEQSIFDIPKWALPGTLEASWRPGRCPDLSLAEVPPAGEGGRKQLARIKGRCHHLACNLLSRSAGEAKEKLSKLMSSLSRLHWHSKRVEQHFGFKSSSKWQIQSPTVKVLQRCRRVSVPDHQSNFCFLVMRHRCRQLVIGSALALRLPAFSAAQPASAYTAGKRGTRTSAVPWHKDTRPMWKAGLGKEPWVLWI